MVNFSGSIPTVIGLAVSLIAILAVGVAVIAWARTWRRLSLMA